jgi:hypothetical protein
MTRLAALLIGGFGTVLGFCTACNAAPARETAPSARTEPASAMGKVVARTNAVSSVSAALVMPSSVPASPAGAAKPESRRASSLQVKRFVVTTRVQDREPVVSNGPLLADGSAIYAFAELANALGDSENVRITFERKGGAERVGNVTLPIPAQVSRHRTWATTRFIRAPGVWDAVLWSESGTELGRTSFEVAASS